MNATTSSMEELAKRYREEGAPLTLIAALHAFQRALAIYTEEVKAWSEIKEAQRVIEQGIEPEKPGMDAMRRLAEQALETREKVALKILLKAP